MVMRGLDLKCTWNASQFTRAEGIRLLVQSLRYHSIQSARITKQKHCPVNALIEYRLTAQPNIKWEYTQA